MPTDYFIPVVEGDGAPKLTDEQEQNLVIHSNQSWTNWVEMTNDVRANAIIARQLYDENRADDETFDTADAETEGLSNIRRPIMAQAIDSVLAQQHLASYPSDESFFRGKSKNKLTAKLLPAWEKHTEKRLSEKNFMTSTYGRRKNGMLDCSGVAWHPFIRETENKMVYEHAKVFGFPIPGTMKGKRKEVVTFEGTGYIPLSFNDVAFDPQTDTIDETGIIFRRWVPVEALKGMSDVFKNTTLVESVSESMKAFDEAQSRKDEEYRLKGINITFNNPTYEAVNDHALLYEHWDDFYIDGKCYENHVLIYSNDKLFHYFGPNPYDHQMKPFTIVPYNYSAGTLIGKSLAIDVIPLCHVQDTFLNQSIDIVNRLINPWFSYIDGDDILKTFFADGVRSIMPGEGVPVTSHDSIMLRTWDLGMLRELGGMMEMIKEEIRESTGGVPYATGGTSPAGADKTLGEVEILANGTSTRNQIFVQIYEQYGDKPYIKMLYANDKQFMTQPIWIDDEEVLLTPDMVKMMDADFDITGSKTISNRSQAQQTIDAFLTTGLPELKQMGMLETNGDMPIFNIPELLKRWFTSRDFHGVDQFMEVMTAQEREAQMQQMQPQMPGMPGIGGLSPDGLQAVSTPAFAGPTRDMAAANPAAGMGGAMPNGPAGAPPSGQGLG